MRISVEIKGDEVKFDYEVGTSKASANSKLSAVWLETFTDILRAAHKAWSQTVNERKENLWIEKLKEDAE